MDTFKAMWGYLWAFIYEILAIFGIEKDEEGYLVEKK